MNGKLLLMAAVIAVAALTAAGIDAQSASAQAAPAANPGGPYRGVVGDPITFIAAQGPGANLRYDWTFGDGTVGTGSSITKVYAQPGVYTVTLTVTDATGARSTATTTAAVSQFGCLTVNGDIIPCPVLFPVSAPIFVNTGVVTTGGVTTSVFLRPGVSGLVRCSSILTSGVCLNPVVVTPAVSPACVPVQSFGRIICLPLGH